LDIKCPFFFLTMCNFDRYISCTNF
jgi:hypothetical protein